MNTFSIKDLENLSGIKAHTIRIWEQRYSFLKPQRSKTNIRHYSNEELKKILNISLLNKYGYKISHINKMNPEQMREKVLSLSSQEAQHERILHDLIHYMIDMDVEKFEKVLDSYIMARGIEKAINNVVFPFLEKIGILWITNHIEPAQEHLVSNIIRQKIIVGIESCTSRIHSNKKVLLFLPEGEFHELGLLYTYYLLKSRGAQTIYLGANVPLKDVAFVINYKKPDYIYSHLTTVNSNFSMERFLNKFAVSGINIPLILSGQLTQSYQKKLSPNVVFKKSLAEVLEFVASL
jgi:methanogenic corrinoid protein MtbC1